MLNSLKSKELELKVGKKDVPGLRRNLISLGSLDKVGFCYRSEKGILIVSKDTLVKLIAKVKNGLHVLKRNNFT